MPKRFQVFGHRGNGRGRGENTLASCRAALASGADGIELDVQLIDGELMLAHPPRRPQASLEPVLRELNCPVFLHLKRRHLSRGHDRKALAVLERVQYRPGMVISSCWPGTLRYAKRRHPGLTMVFITRWLGWDRRFAKSLGVAEFHTWHVTLTARALRKTPQRVTVFVPNRRIRLPVDGVITDDVSAFAKR
jgi:glycerophosphoryl diester phosphodiesterase